MKRDISFYLNRAMKRTGCSSDLKLCQMLGMGKNAVFHWRNKGIYPSDEAMLKIADLAGIDHRTALIDLNMWRNQDNPAAFKIYSRIAQVVGQSVAHLALVLAVLGSMTSPSLAVDKVSSDNGNNIYYLKV